MRIMASGGKSCRGRATVRSRSARVILQPSRSNCDLAFCWMGGRWSAGSACVTGHSLLQTRIVARRQDTDRARMGHGEAHAPAALPHTAAQGSNNPNHVMTGQGLFLLVVAGAGFEP